jgi:hypothetical protein
LYLIERLGQMRSDEKHAVRNGGAITPFGGLPVYVQLALAASGKGATFWARPQADHQHPAPTTPMWPTPLDQKILLLLPSRLGLG